MLSHPFFQYFGRHIFSIGINKEPSAYLRMPDQAMTSHSLFVFFSKSNEFISIIPYISIFFRMNGLGFHAIFGNNSAEFFSNQFRFDGVNAINLLRIDCYTKQKFSFGSISQSFLSHGLYGCQKTRAVIAEKILISIMN